MPLVFYNLNQSFFPTATDDPPRPSFDSQLSRDMAGYMPARADFMEVSAVCFLYTGIHKSFWPMIQIYSHITGGYNSMFLCIRV